MHAVDAVHNLADVTFDERPSMYCFVIVFIGLSVVRIHTRNKRRRA
jgi:hypothetical protein